MWKRKRGPPHVWDRQATRMAVPRRSVLRSVTQGLGNDVWDILYNSSGQPIIPLRHPGTFPQYASAGRITKSAEEPGGRGEVCTDHLEACRGMTPTMPVGRGWVEGAAPRSQSLRVTADALSRVIQGTRAQCCPSRCHECWPRLVAWFRRAAERARTQPRHICAALAPAHARGPG